MSAREPTASEMFGDEPPGVAVPGTIPMDPCTGYRERPRFRRRSDGRAYVVPGPAERRETELPASYYKEEDEPMPPTNAPAATAAPAMTVYDCIVGVSREIATVGVSKSRSNLQQNYKFRGIDDVLNALSPLLAKYRLVILPRILSRTVVEHASKSGGVLFYVTVEAEFDFVSAADSSRHTVKTYGEAMDSADKATNKAMSAAYKYAAFQTFCIPTEGDNDADATTHEPVIQIRETPAAPAVAMRVDPSAGDSGARPSGAEAPGDAALSPGTLDAPPDGALYVTSVETRPTKNPKVIKALINFTDGRVRSTINTAMMNLATKCKENHRPVWVEDAQSQYGWDLLKLTLASTAAEIAATKWAPEGSQEAF